MLPSHTQRYAVGMWYFDSQEKLRAEEGVTHSAVAVEKERKRIESEIDRFEHEHQTKAVVSKTSAASTPGTSSHDVLSDEPALSVSKTRETSHLSQVLDEVDLDALD